MNHYTTFATDNEPTSKRKSFTPHQQAVIDSLQTPIDYKSLYEKLPNIPQPSVRRILSTFKNEGLVTKTESNKF